MRPLTNDDLYKMHRGQIKDLEYLWREYRDKCDALNKTLFDIAYKFDIPQKHVEPLTLDDLWRARWALVYKMYSVCEENIRED